MAHTTTAIKTMEINKMKRKNNITIEDNNTSKQVSFGESNDIPSCPRSNSSILSNSDNDDENESSIEDGTRSTARTTAYKRSSTSSLSSTALSTMFYSQCALSGISSEDADNAISESRNWYHNWWRQQRFQNNDNDNTKECHINNDPKSSWPKKNRRLNNSVSIDNSCNTANTTSDDSLSETSSSHLIPDDDAESLKRQVLQSLRSSGGDVTDSVFLKYLSMLQDLYSSMTAAKTLDNLLPEEKKDEEEGMLPSESSGAGVWVTLNKPHFQECLGRHPVTGEYMYTLGRM